MITRNHVTSIHDYSVFKIWLPGYPSSYASRCRRNRAGEPNVREFYGQCMKVVQLPFTHIPLDMLSQIRCCCSVTKSCSTLQSHELQHISLSCPSLSPRVFSNSWPLSWWWYLTISSSAVPFSFCLQSFSASRTFPKSWLFAWGNQDTGASASASVLPMSCICCIGRRILYYWATWKALGFSMAGSSLSPSGALIHSILSTNFSFTKKSAVDGRCSECMSSSKDLSSFLLVAQTFPWSVLSILYGT